MRARTPAASPRCGNQEHDAERPRLVCYGRGADQARRTRAGTPLLLGNFAATINKSMIPVAEPERVSMSPPWPRPARYRHRCPTLGRLPGHADGPTLTFQQERDIDRSAKATAERQHGAPAAIVLIPFGLRGLNASQHLSERFAILKVDMKVSHDATGW
jgi:hypothetical protein